MKVRNIVESQGDYSRVVVDSETFAKINGFKPVLPYETARNAKGQGVRIFQVDGVTVYAVRVKEQGRTLLTMKTEDAVKNLQTLEQERSNETPLPFAFEFEQA